MNLIQYIRKFLTTLTLVSVLALAAAFGVVSQDSWAAVPSLIAASTAHNQIAQVNKSLVGRAKATDKNIAGKAQETTGNITGDPKAQIEGKVQQAESQVRHAAEDVKDSMSLKGKPKAAAKYIEGKGQEAIGNITGDPEAQTEGKVKQVEGKVRYGAEVVKEKVKGVLN